MKLLFGPDSPPEWCFLFHESYPAFTAKWLFFFFLNYFLSEFWMSIGFCSFCTISFSSIWHLAEYENVCRYPVNLFLSPHLTTATKNKNTSRFLQNKHFSNIFLLSNNVLILLRKPIIYLENCTFKHLKWSFVWLNNPFGCYFYLSKVLTKCFVGIPLVLFLDHVIVLTICCLITNYSQISYLKQMFIVS